MILTTTPQIEGKQIVQYHGIVTGEVIAGINFVKDAFAGLQAGKAKLALDASPVSGSNEDCFKNIRIA